MEPSSHNRDEGSQPTDLPGRRAWFVFAGLAVLGLALRALAIANTAQEAVGNMPLPDDAFYYFVLARNVTAGLGPVISGNGVPTTGFQPLWAGLLAGIEGIAGGFDPSSRILAAQWMGALLGIATAAVVFLVVRRLTRDDLPALLTAGAFLLSPQIVKHNLNGMETSLALLGVASLIAFGLTFSPSESHRGPALLLGVGCGLVILARVDLLLLVGLLALKWIWTASRGGKGWDRIGLVAVGIGLVIVPWLLFALQVGVGVLPESGQAVRNLTLLLHDLPLMDLGDSLRAAPEVFLPVYLRYAIEFTSAWVRQVPALLPLTLPTFVLLPANAAENATAVVALMLGIGLAIAALRSGNRMFTAAVVVGGTFVILMTSAYATAILGPWFFQRYAAPIGLLAHLLLWAAVASLVLRSRRRTAVYGLAAAGIAAGFAALILEGSYRWIVAGESAVPDDGFFRAAEAIEANLPDEARVGVFSAGLITYSLRQPVVALDGKVNRLARQAMSDGQMFAYLCADGVEYVADWEKMVDRLLVRRSEDWQDDNLRLLETIGVEDGNDILIYKVNREACDGESAGS